jgi:predicted enzyme related to lactoylglutathione lyase
MSTRDRYPHGVPCFVDTLTPDPEAARRFYAGVFGWSFAGPGPLPGDPPGSYWVAQLDGDDVAGLGSPPPAAGPPPAWNTHIAVSSADDAAGRVAAAGGRVLAAPFDAPPAGRLAVVQDPAGADFGLWEAGDRQGAARVNEPSAWAMSLLSTGDADNARAFYGDVFGWRGEPMAGAPAVWLWRLPGFVGGEPEQPVPRDVVAVMAAEAPGPPRWSVDFWIADAAAATAAVPGLGGAVLAEPHEEGMFRRAVLADPAGAAFSVSQLLTR